MAGKGKRKSRAGSRSALQRLWVPRRDGLRAIEAGSKDHYDLQFVAGELLSGRYTWRARVTVPGFDVAHSLLIQLEEFRVHVVVEDWSGAKLKHTFGQNRLCMWYPSDPPEKTWHKEDGLLKLLDTAVEHLFKEYHYRETGEWLGEEMAHGPKVEATGAIDQQMAA